MSQKLREILIKYDHCINLEDIPIDLRQAIHKLCSEYMGGIWDTIRAEHLRISPIRGGTSNVLFLCELPDSNRNIDPNECLLRIYCNASTEDRLLEESVVFSLLAERKFGPKLYGIFEDGRLEEHIRSRALMAHEIRLPHISMKIARILARIHGLEMPIKKRPSYLGECMRKWIKELRSIYKDRNFEAATVHPEIRTLDDLESEVELVIRCMESSQYPVVFCHNDFQEGNILFKSTDHDLETADFCVIDYEYASYNYRAFDIANHFCEWTFDYISNKEHPYFKCEYEFFPTTDDQWSFARTYLDSMSSADAGDARVLLDEVKSFVPVSHFFWSVWALLLAETSPVQFGYTEYAQCRFALYYQHRSDLLRLLKS